MNLFIRLSLVLDIGGDDGGVPELTHGIDIVPLGPELTTPELVFDFGMCREYHFRSDTLGDLGETSGSIVGH